MSTTKELDDTDPADAFQDALSGSLHQETRVFDFGRVGLSLVSKHVNVSVVGCVTARLSMARQYQYDL